MTESGRKRCVVAYATPERQFLWTVDVRADATVAEVLEAARMSGGGDSQEMSIPWDTAPVGIFGEACTRATVPAAGDRIELYRPLHSDPRARRREQVQRARRAKRT